MKWSSQRGNRDDLDVCVAQMLLVAKFRRGIGDYGSLVKNKSMKNATQQRSDKYTHVGSVGLVARSGYGGLGSTREYLNQSICVHDDHSIGNGAI